jgi:UDP:flavonoid glycosyltransferase YjiC (YdhE family)
LRSEVNKLYRTGIPQVLLPAWYDCYDYATRVEYLGIGIYGNKKVAPNVEKEEFANAVLRVIGEKKGVETQFSVKAKELGVVCRKSGGRKKVAEMISELVLEGKAGG